MAFWLLTHYGTEAALPALYGDNENSDLVIRLQPLVHLHGELRLAKPALPPPWSAVCLYVPTDERKPLAYSRVAICGTWDGSFSLMLPPGEYD